MLSFLLSPFFFSRDYGGFKGGGGWGGCVFSFLVITAVLREGGNALMACYGWAGGGGNSSDRRAARVKANIVTVIDKKISL